MVEGLAILREAARRQELTIIAGRIEILDLRPDIAVAHTSCAASNPWCSCPAGNYGLLPPQTGQKQQHACKKQEHALKKGLVSRPALGCSSHAFLSLARHELFFISYCG